MVPKPALLLEVEAALDAAEKAKAELKAFDESHPNLGVELAAQTTRLEYIEAALKADPSSPVNTCVLVALSDAHRHQREVVSPLRELYEQGRELHLEAQWAGLAYVYASRKWDASAERLDYLQALIYQE